MNKINLIGKTLSELVLVTNELKLPKYLAKEIALWIYKRKASSIQEMTNLSLKARELLSENYTVGLKKHITVHTSADGTKKYLYMAGQNKFIETAYMPEDNRNTLCVSSQVGCKMGCLFCMTAKQGFQGQLSSAEIINQVLSLPESEKLTNLVYMGMGEPFDNIDEVLKSLEILCSDYGFGWSPKRITVSTIGIIPAMKRFVEETKCHLAISLHSPFDEERRQLMPIQNIYPVKEVIDLLKSFDFNRQRRISFEYILFKGLNDSKNHANELARLLNGIRCRINLLNFHTIPGSPLKSPSQTDLNDFKNLLEKKGLTTTIRKTRGEDIMAACGLLSTKEIEKNLL